eukprot:6028136-Amphidinium_carterae.1
MERVSKQSTKSNSKSVQQCVGSFTKLSGCASRCWADLACAISVHFVPHIHKFSICIPQHDII